MKKVTIYFLYIFIFITVISGIILFGIVNERKDALKKDEQTLKFPESKVSNSVFAQQNTKYEVSEDLPVVFKLKDNKHILDIFNVDRAVEDSTTGFMINKDTVG